MGGKENTQIRERRRGGRERGDEVREEEIETPEG